MKRVAAVVGLHRLRVGIREMRDAGFKPGDRVVVMSAEDAAADVRHVEWEDALRLEREAARESGRVEAAAAIAAFVANVIRKSEGNTRQACIIIDNGLTRFESWRAFLPGAKDGG